MVNKKPSRGPALCYASTKPKIRYRDRVGALLALANISYQDKPGRAVREQRPYRCPSCRGFHLTSQKRKESSRSSPEKQL